MEKRVSKGINRWDFTYSEFVEFCKQHQGMGISPKYGSMSSDSSFSGSSSLKQALEYAENGFDEYTNKMQDVANNIQSIGRAFTFTPKYEVSGESVDVGRYMTGEPENMLEWEQIETRGNKVLDIYWNLSTSCGVDKNEMIGFGACGLSIVDYLESVGVRVNLYVFDYCHGGHSSESQFMICVKIKSANEHLNMPVVAFAMTHPSMLRRLVFCVQENDRKYLDGGYGTPRTLKKEQIERTNEDVIVFDRIDNYNRMTNFEIDADMKKWIQEHTQICLNEINIKNEN